jgi:hypothetical protein
VRVNIHLKFTADVEDESEAWEIADRLEKAAVARGYVAVTGWVDLGDSSRLGVLVPEGQEAVTTQADRIERISGLTPTGIGDPTVDGGASVSPSAFGTQD